MSMKIWLPVFLYVLSVKIDINTGAEFDNCKEFVQIDESNYDRDPDSKRPLGFMSTTILYKGIHPNAKNPCFQITLDNSTKQTVQVLATAAVGGSQVCVISDIPGAQQTCDNPALTTCPYNAIGHNTIKYEFFCETCEYDISIWFRLTVSPPFTDGLQFERWCDDFNSNYPDSLIVLSGAPPEQKTPPTSKARHASLELTWIVCLNFILLVIPLFY